MSYLTNMKLPFLYFIIKGHFFVAEACLLVVFGLNALLDLLRYLNARFSSSVIELSAVQKKLLGVKDMGK